MRRGGVLILLIVMIVIVGGVMVFMFLQGQGTGVGGNSATTTLPTEPPLVDIVRARVDIKANTVITNSDMQLELGKVPQSEFDVKKDFSKIVDVQGQLALRDIGAGDPIGKSDLTEPGLSQQIPTAESPRPRDKAYPFVVNNLSGVSDQIKPGDFVDIVATFVISRRTSFPIGETMVQQGAVQVPMLQREVTEAGYSVTKTIVQRAQVLKIMRPPVPLPDATPVANGAAAPQTQSSSLPLVDASGKPITATSPGSGDPSSITQGIWTLLLAVNDQEVELIEFSLSTNSRMVLVLRGAGDTTFEPSIGATFDLLVSEFGVPLPQQQPPNVISPNQVFTPEPTRTPAPTRVP